MQMSPGAAQLPVASCVGEPDRNKIGKMMRDQAAEQQLNGARGDGSPQPR